VEDHVAALHRADDGVPVGDIGGHVVAHERLGRGDRAAQRPHLRSSLGQQPRHVGPDEPARARDQRPGQEPIMARRDCLTEVVVCSTAVGS
jgi:hypothetical protein